MTMLLFERAILKYQNYDYEKKLYQIDSQEKKNLPTVIKNIMN